MIGKNIVSKKMWKEWCKNLKNLAVQMILTYWKRLQFCVRGWSLQTRRHLLYSAPDPSAVSCLLSSFWIEYSWWSFLKVLVEDASIPKMWHKVESLYPTLCWAMAVLVAELTCILEVFLCLGHILHILEWSDSFLFWVMPWIHLFIILSVVRQLHMTFTASSWWSVKWK